jgi:hypothetical protein
MIEVDLILRLNTLVKAEVQDVGRASLAHSKLVSVPVRVLTSLLYKHLISILYEY